MLPFYNRSLRSTTSRMKASDGRWTLLRMIGGRRFGRNVPEVLCTRSRHGVHSFPTSFSTLRLSLWECVKPISRSMATVSWDRNATTHALRQLLDEKFPPEPCRMRSWCTVTSPLSISAALGLSSSDNVAANVCDLSLSPCSGPWCLKCFSRCEPGTNCTHPFSSRELSIASQKDAVLVSFVTGQYAKSWCLQHSFSRQIV